MYFLAFWSSHILIKDTVICKRRTVEFLLSGRSLISIRKRMGPSTEPWETPDKTGAGSEQTPSMTTFCVCQDSQAVIHWRISFRIPKYPSLYASLRCGTLSKVLANSKFWAKSGTIVKNTSPLHNNEVSLLVTSIKVTIQIMDWLDNMSLARPTTTNAMLRLNFW